MSVSNRLNQFAIVVLFASFFMHDVLRLNEYSTPKYAEKVAYLFGWNFLSMHLKDETNHIITLTMIDRRVDEMAL